jgi:hypothetical protein
MDNQGFVISVKTAIMEPTVAIKVQKKLVSETK